MANRKAPQDNRIKQIDPTSEAWNKLPWRKLEQHVYRIQKRIYQASQRGNVRAVQKLQKLLMKSEAARLLAVRRVTQENQGKKTAGVDGIKKVKPQQRKAMAQAIHPKKLETSENPTSKKSVDTKTRKGRKASVRNTSYARKSKTGIGKSGPRTRMGSGV